MKNTLKAFGVLLILISLCVAYILKSAGVFRSINPHFDGQEEVLESSAGIEDITINHETGQVFLSSHDRRNFNKPGAIYTFNANESSPIYKNITADLNDSEFRPHGISLLEKYGKTYLFAISHDTEAQYVDRFEIRNDSIIARQRFTDELFISPNDLVAVDTATFYFTNDHGMPKGTERKIKDFLLDKNGYVVLFHNGISKKVTQNMAYANGINVSPDGQYLYVSTTTEAKLFVYKNDIESDQLALLDVLDTGTGLDNIEIDVEGNLIIGAHPQMLKFLSHSKAQENRSPSQVLKVIYLPNTEYKFLQEELYLNNGDPLSGSSVGAYYERKDGSNNLFVGSVFENKILRLQRNL